MRAGQQIVGLLWRWHRRTGVAIFVFLLLLSVTGVVLNHSTDLGLNEKFVDAPWLVRVYGDSSADQPAYRLGAKWISRAPDGHLYLDATEAAPCLGDFAGAIERQSLIVAACTEELILLTPDGQLIESVSATSGLPVPLTGIGESDDGVMLHSSQKWWLADLDQLEFQQAREGVLIQQLAPGVLPAAITDAIPAPQQWLSWERLLLDLHSGRILGLAGVLLVDLVGILLICIACSGLVMWWLRRRRRRPARQSDEAS